MLNFISRWELLIGYTVELWKDGTYVRTAVVDDATSDSSEMWLRAEWSEHRKIILSNDEYELRVHGWPKTPMLPE
jgi:hypothetical protein